MTRDTCRDCSAFSGETRECRRHSPVMVPVPQTNALGQVSGYAAAGLFPATSEASWCREFERAPVVQVLP